MLTNTVAIALNFIVESVQLPITLANLHPSHKTEKKSCLKEKTFPMLGISFEFILINYIHHFILI